MQFLIQQSLVKRPRHNRTSMSLCCSWRVATTLFPSLSWRSHRGHQDGGCLGCSLKPEDGGDTTSELVALLRASNDSFTRRFHSHKAIECDDGTEGREHNATFVVCNSGRHPIHIRWVNRNTSQTLPDVKQATTNCGFLHISYGVRTGTEDDTEEDCLPRPLEDFFADTEKENAEKMQELEADNARLRCKCKALMNLVFSMGGTVAMIAKASRASNEECKKCFEVQAKRRWRGEAGGEKKAKTQTSCAMQAERTCMRSRMHMGLREVLASRSQCVVTSFSSF